MNFIGVQDLETAGAQVLEATPFVVIRDVARVFFGDFERPQENV